MRFILLSLVILASFCNAYEDRVRTKSAPAKDTTNEDADYWMNLGQEELTNAMDVQRDLNFDQAKNIIIFVGDGMSLPDLTASRIYKAQRNAREKGYKVNGEESFLEFEKFPHVGLAKTYCVDRQTPDSAATATAMFCGVKTDIDALGFDNSIEVGNADSELKANKISSILKWAQDARMDTGFVTTTRVSHATPAALYAHSADRFWECDKKLPEGAPEDVKDISWQLIHNDPGNKIKVMLGGGRSSFIPEEDQTNHTNINARWDYEEDDWQCGRQDKENLINIFLNESEHNHYIESLHEMNELDINEVDRVLGLFAWTYMHFDWQRRSGSFEDSKDEPNLEQLTEFAIKMMQKSEEGYFLLIEGGKIDFAHHGSRATEALDETVAMDEAVEKALSMVDLKDTLFIVTADHSHTMAMSGYQSRGADIRGIVDNNDPETLDGKPFTILSYANGKSFDDHITANESCNGAERIDISDIDYKDYEYRQIVSVPLDSETHSGTDVGIFAAGPYAHLFHGVHEQTHIAHVMAYSACIGPYGQAETRGPHCNFRDGNNSGSKFSVTASMILATLATIFLH